MDERYTLTVEREIPGPIAAVFDAWLDAATMAQWMSPAPDISVEAVSEPVVGGQFRVVMKGRPLVVGAPIVQRSVYPIMRADPHIGGNSENVRSGPILRRWKVPQVPPTRVDDVDSLPSCLPWRPTI